jgi:single-stranded DNA-binding protein
MAYATATVIVKGPPSPVIEHGKELFTAPAEIPGEPPVRVQLAVPATASSLARFQETATGSQLIVSGPLSLISEGKVSDGKQPSKDLPRIVALVVCPATEEQFLNEAVLVGRIGGEAKEASSGKSTKRSMAINSYHKDPATGEIVEETDWHGLRGFGFNQQKLARLASGSLVEVAGALSQMTSKAGDPYPEVKVRSISSHKGGKGGGDLAKGTKAAGYDSSAFAGEEFDPDAWD